MDEGPDLRTLRAAVTRAGFVLRGAFHCDRDDGVAGPGGGAAGTLALVGSVGATGFPAVRDAVSGHPLDRFTERVVEPLAASLGARALYPHRGPPWLPFQRWAARAEAVATSPLGILIHPRHGLWHAYRAALAFRGRLPGVAPPARATSPCGGCRHRPCLEGCPVGAFDGSGFDAAACRAHLASAEGHPCRDQGCLARLACPVAPELRYRGEQARFHLRAFARACPEDRTDDG